MKTLMRFLCISIAGFMVGTAIAQNVAPRPAPVSGAKKSGKQEKEKKVSPAVQPPPSPVYSRKEFQHFVTINDTGHARVELAPLILSNRFVVRTYDNVDFKKLEEQFAALGMTASPVPAMSEMNSDGFASLILTALPALTQDDLLLRLNKLSQMTDQTWDVTPVFFIGGREAIVAGVRVSFSAPFSSAQFGQMLESYGGIPANELELIETSSTTDWEIRPLRKGRMFAVGRYLDQRTSVTARKFDMNFLLLANLLEANQLFTGITVKSARPIFMFVGDPLRAELSFEWSSGTVSDLRKIQLTITVIDPERVRFNSDPSRLLPPLSGEFFLKANGDLPQPGWVKFVKDGKIAERGEWIQGESKIIPFGDQGKLAIFTYSFPLYVFQPEESWLLGKLDIPYEYFDVTEKRWKKAVATASQIPFWVLTHRSKEGKIRMPKPALTPAAKETDEFLAPTAPPPGANGHWMTSWVNYAGGGERGGQVIAVASIISMALGALVLFFGSMRLRTQLAEERLGGPRVVPLVEEGEFSRRFQHLFSGSETVEEYFTAFRAGRKCLEEMLVARIPGFREGHLSVMNLKELKKRSGADRRIVDAMDMALELLLKANKIDAPKGTLEIGFLKEEWSKFSEEIRGLRALLSELPVRMTQGGDNVF